MAETGLIRTPDQRVRVFVSSSLQELAAERRAVRYAITGLRLVPMMFELGARPHPPRDVYRAYLAQSQVFMGIYWQSCGWVAPGERMSGLEDEYVLSAGMPRLIYVKSPAPDREPRLADMLNQIKDSGDVSYRHFWDPEKLQSLVQNDLAVLLSERFEMAHVGVGQAQEALASAMPAPTTPLVGREREAEAASELVLREGVRLVTFTGPGGVGKSRLALEVGRRLESSFADGVRFVDLARRLDGLPLAIELAAARSRLLPPQALLVRLDDRMSLLNQGARDLPERQRTLRNTLDWSFGLLSPAEQALLSRLGVFPGTFDLEAAEAVGGAGGSAPAGQDRTGQIIHTLGSPVDASLIRDTERAGRRRFSLLEIIREYARERLGEEGQWQEAHDRHAAHFLELAEAARAGLEGPSQVAWLDRLEAEHDNLSAAISWLLAQDQPGPALQLIAMTWQYWWLRGHTEESARYGEVIVASGEKVPPGQLGYAQIGLGVLLILSGDKARAQVLFQQAPALFRRLGDKRGMALATGYLGHVAALRGDYERPGSC
jgi:predicted ATPase